MLMYCSDPQRTAKGRLSLKALRLTPAMMAMYHDGDFTHDACVYLNIILLWMLAETAVLLGMYTTRNNYCTRLVFIVQPLSKIDKNW